MRNRVFRLLHERVLPIVHGVAAACCAVAVAPLAAHPHVWITYTSVARMDGSVLGAVQERWTFSQGFPVSIVGDLTAMPTAGPVGPKYIRIFRQQGFPVSIVGDLTAMPTAGPVGPKYIRIFRQQAFDSLKRADYFTHVFVDGKAARFGEVRDFAVSVKGGQIVYTFVLPLADKVDLKLAQVQVGIWDETFFVDFQSPSRSSTPVVFDATAEKSCTAEPFEDKVHPIFGGAIFPLSVRLSC